MFQYLDHDDFKKSLKAFIITSSSLLIINHLNITGSSLNFFGFKLEIDKSSAIAIGGMALLYFIYVFIIRSYEYLAEYRYNRIINHINSYDEAVSGFKEESQNPETKDTKSRLLDIKRDNEKFLRNIRTLTFLSIDITPAIIIAITTLVYVAPFSAIELFFKN